MKIFKLFVCIYLLIFLGAFLPGNPTLVIPAVTAVQGNVGILTFSEEFNNGDCSIPCVSNPTKYSRWKTNYYFGNQTNTIAGLGSRSYSTGSQALDNVFVSATGGDPIVSPNSASGKLHIAGDLMSATNQSLYSQGGTRPYYSAVMTTQNSFAQQYGYWEIKATLPNQNINTGACPTIVPAQCLSSVSGSWPAFWLLPANLQYSGTFPEIDVMEHYGGQWIVPSASQAIVSQVWSAGTVTVTTTNPHGRTPGSSFNAVITSATPSAYSTTSSGVAATSTGTNTFTYSLVSDPGANTVPGNYALGNMIDRVARPVSTLHYGTNTSPLAVSNSSNLPARIDLTIPHIFSVYWSPTEIDFYIDQTNVLQITDSAILNNMNSTSMYILLSMVIGNTPTAGDPTLGTYPTDYSIDYVRVWNLK